MSKKSIKKILVPIDGSKNSLKGLDQAISIARECHAKITGLYVIPFFPRNLGDALIPYYLIPEKEAKKFMNEAKKRAAKKGILFQSKIVRGSPTSEILDMSKKRFDMLVIGSRGRGSAKEVFLGSVSNAIVHKSQIPVMVVR